MYIWILEKEIRCSEDFLFFQISSLILFIEPDLTYIDLNNMKKLHFFWMNVLTKSDKWTQPKIFWESCFICPVSLCLKNVTFLHSFCNRKHVRQTGPDLLFVLLLKSIYDSRLTFLFLVGVEGPAYLSKPEEFSLQLCLTEGGLLLPRFVTDVKVGSSTMRCNSL